MITIDGITKDPSGSDEFTTTTDPIVNGAVSTTIIDDYAGVVVTLTTTGNAQTLQTPSDTTAGKRFTVANSASSTGSVTVNTVAIDTGKAMSWVWSGTTWIAVNPQALSSTGSPTFATTKNTNLTDGYIPYHVSDASGLANSGVYWDGSKLGIGTPTPLTPLTVAETATTSPRGILSQQFSTSTDGARVGFSKARGTIASPTTVATGDTIGRLMFRGYDGANYLEMASIESGVSGTVASTRVPTYIALSTATDAAPSVLTERMRITNSGNVGIGTTAPVTTLDVSGTARSLTNITTHSATENVTAASMYGDAHIVTGAYTVSLPTAALGYRATFMASTAAVFSVDVLTGTDVIILDGTALTAGNKITSDGTIYSKVYVECVLAGKYNITTINGIFIDGGA